MGRARSVLCPSTMPARTLPRASTPYQLAQDPAAKAAILAAWTAADGRPDAAAHALGLSRSTLYREILRLGMGADLPGYSVCSAIVT